MQYEGVLVVDFGGQYNQLIARRVREAHVYCEIVSYRNCLEKIKEARPWGIIFTGGPASVYEEGAPTLPKEIFERLQSDFEYEKNIADVNRQLAGIETFLLFTLPEHMYVSSSIVRELLHYGKDISQFVPKGTGLY